MSIGEQIRRYRCRSSLKQSQLAELVGVSPQAISKWETGAGSPDVSALVPLAKALRITTDELLGYREGTDGMRSEWDDMALAYEIFNNSPDSYSYTIEWPCIQSLMPDIRGKSVLDVGCGTGIFTFLLEQYFPAAIVGIDYSEEMLKIAAAKKMERRSHAQFVQGDAGRLGEYFEDAFDFIFSSTTTHYLPDLHGLLRSIHRLLKEDGTCILSVIHPVYSAQYPVDRGERFPREEEWRVRYLDRSRRAYIQPWIEYNDDFENRLSRSFHYTFGDYVSAILSAGLNIQEVREPMPPENWKLTSFGRYDGYLETPVYLILKLGK